MVPYGPRYSGGGAGLPPGEGEGERPLGEGEGELPLGEGEPPLGEGDGELTDCLDTGPLGPELP